MLFVQFNLIVLLRASSYLFYGFNVFCSTQCSLHHEMKVVRVQESFGKFSSGRQQTSLAPSLALTVTAQQTTHIF